MEKGKRRVDRETSSRRMSKKKKGESMTETRFFRIISSGFNKKMNKRERNGIKESGERSNLVR